MSGNWIDMGRGSMLIGFMVYVVAMNLRYGSRPAKRSEWRGDVDGIIRGYLKWSKSCGADIKQMGR